LDRVDRTQLGLGHFREGEFDDLNKIHHRSYHGPGLADGAGAAGGACKRYENAYWLDLRHHYLANVAQIDDEIGRVLDAVERTLGKESLIVFTCDHGEMMGNHRLWGKQACGYEDVICVPLFVRLPGGQESQRMDDRVSLVDLLPTTLAIAGVESPPTDGWDLRKSVNTGGRPLAFGEEDGFVAATDGRYKYVHFGRDEQLCELYDLAEDPLEFRNEVANPDYAPVLANLRAAVIDHLLKYGLDHRPPSST
jgi:arylsulfatase A-like enzyme